MKSKNFLIALLIILVGGGGLLAGYYYQASKTKNYQQELELKKQKISELQKELEEKQAGVKKEETPEVICLGGEKLSGYLSSKEGNIIVYTPKVCEEMAYSVVISGKARVFEGQLNARVKDGKGKILSETIITASVGAPSFGTYKKTLKFSPPQSPELGQVEVYDLSEKDGSILDLVTIPVILKGK